MQPITHAKLRPTSHAFAPAIDRIGRPSCLPRLGQLECRNDASLSSPYVIFTQLSGLRNPGSTTPPPAAPPAPRAPLKLPASPCSPHQCITARRGDTCVRCAYTEISGTTVENIYMWFCHHVRKQWRAIQASKYSGAALSISR